jgi:CRP/FNR family transcriptional regulator, cyclic AMP receptor protein
VTEDVVESLARLALFADLTRPQLESVAHSFEEEVFPAGKRVLREGLSGSAFYLILDGEARVEVGRFRRILGRGEYFGEISVLLGEAPSADVVAESMLRCLVIPGPELEPLLLEHPAMTFRMLQAEARRVRDTTRWES